MRSPGVDSPGLCPVWRNVNRLFDTRGNEQNIGKTAENKGSQHTGCCWDPLFAFGAVPGQHGAVVIDSHSGHMSDPSVLENWLDTLEKKQFFEYNGIVARARM